MAGLKADQNRSSSNKQQCKTTHLPRISTRSPNRDPGERSEGPCLGPTLSWWDAGMITWLGLRRRMGDVGRRRDAPYGDPQVNELASKASSYATGATDAESGREDANRLL